MRETSYTDTEGRQWMVLLPDGVPDAHAHMGLPIGPPSVESLGLPPEAAVRLHNQLFERRIFTARQARGDVAGILAAVRAALRVSAEDVIALYEQGAILAQTTREDAGQGDSP